MKRVVYSFRKKGEEREGKEGVHPTVIFAEVISTPRLCQCVVTAVARMPRIYMRN